MINSETPHRTRAELEPDSPMLSAVLVERAHPDRELRVTANPERGTLHLELIGNGTTARGECEAAFDRPNPNRYSVVATVLVDGHDPTTADAHAYEISVAVTWTLRPDGGTDDLGIAGTALVYEPVHQHTVRFEVQRRHGADLRNLRVVPAAGSNRRERTMTSITGHDRTADGRRRRAFGGLAGRVQSIAASARSRVDDARADRRRRALYADLGEVYFRAASSGQDTPDAGECDPIVDSIRALGAPAAEADADSDDHR